MNVITPSMMMKIKNQVTKWDEITILVDNVVVGKCKSISWNTTHYPEIYTITSTKEK